jgi:hypothetical protein
MDIIERLHYWAFKFCGKGEREDIASDAMTDGWKEIKRLRNFLEILSDKLYDKQDYELWAAVRNTLCQEGEKDEQA